MSTLLPVNPAQGEVPFVTPDAAGNHWVNDGHTFLWVRNDDAVNKVVLAVGQRTGNFLGGIHTTLITATQAYITALGAGQDKDDLQLLQDQAVRMHAGAHDFMSYVPMFTTAPLGPFDIRQYNEPSTGYCYATYAMGGVSNMGVAAVRMIA